MILNRLTACHQFKLRAPIWGGGKRLVGLDTRRIGTHNSITFSYKRKSDGEYSIPGEWYFSGDKLNEVDYDKMTIKGTTLVLIPFSHLEPLERR